MYYWNKFEETNKFKLSECWAGSDVIFTVWTVLHV